MIQAFVRRLFTKLGLLSLFIVYLALGEVYMGASSLWQSLSFFMSSSPKAAQVVDVRRGESEVLYQLLPSGELVFEGCPLYYPIVSYTSPQFMVPLRIELQSPNTRDYQRGTLLNIRTKNDNEQVAQESHGFFMWGGSLIRLSLGLVMTWLAYALFKRARVIKTSTPKPEVQSTAPPAKKPRKTAAPRKKSTAPKKDAAPKKKSTRSKKST